MALRHTHREIAAQLGVTPRCVEKDIAALRAAWRERYTDAAETWIEDETAEIEGLERLALDEFQASGEPGQRNHKLLEVALAYRARKHKLRGLDRPTKTAITDAEGHDVLAGLTDADLEKQLRRAQAEADPEPAEAIGFRLDDQAEDGG
jgi:hypothetical protein